MSDGVVHVIDDDAAMRDSLEFLLESADLTARSYESAVAFLEHLDHLEPGCIVTDVRMPEMSGLELVSRLKDLNVGLPVIVMTGHADVPLAIQAMKAGVLDFIEKPFDDEALISVIRAALNQARDQGQRAAELSEIRAKLESLSPRERDVLEGLVAGSANKVIAYDLGISPRTVEIYRANLMTKMGAASLSELVRMKLAAEPG
ncbi:MAG: response regulator transcription factor FixJ [Alphaproteobacteria bacterium]|nr:response regulator transcription factor FixJ [Alphaproteobacteria bacterium]